MVVPRFQVVRAARYVYLPAPREPGPDAGVEPPRATGFAWRFMSANNLGAPTRAARGKEVVLTEP